MLKSITDFTIPHSHTHLFYETQAGNMLTKSYKKHFDNGFFVNGYVDTYSNSIFKNVNKSKFEENKRMLHIPPQISS